MSRRRQFNWDMRLYGNCQNWYDPSDASTITLDVNVSVLADKTGRDDLSNATGIEQPAIASADQAGLDTLQFSGGQQLNAATINHNFLHDGTKNVIAAIAKFGIDSNPNTLYAFLVTRDSPNSVGYVSFFDDRASASRNEVIYNLIRNNTNNPFLNISGNLGCPVNAYHTVIIETDPTNSVSGDKGSILIDTNTPIKGLTVSGALPTGNSETPLALGRTPLSLSWGLVGNVGEIAIYSGDSNYPLSFLQRLLDLKWQITYTPDSVVTLLLRMDETGTTFVDSSKSEVLISNVGGMGHSTVSPATDLFGTNAADFNADTNRLQLANGSIISIAENADFTLEFWLYWQSIRTDNRSYINGLFDTDGFSGANTGLKIYHRNANASAQSFTARFDNGITPAVALQHPTPTLEPIGQWRHYAVTRNANIVRLYVHGTKVAQETYAPAIPFANNTPIGAIFASDGTRNANALMKEFRLSTIDQYNAAESFSVPASPFSDP